MMRIIPDILIKKNFKLLQLEWSYSLVNIGLMKFLQRLRRKNLEKLRTLPILDRLIYFFV